MKTYVVEMIATVNVLLKREVNASSEAEASKKALSDNITQILVDDALIHNCGDTINISVEDVNEL